MKTALNRVHSNILDALDSRMITLLLLLDPSVAYDRISHTILFQRLRPMFGPKYTVLECFTYYLNKRMQSVKVANIVSDNRILQCCVHQGLILEPFLYRVYICIQMTHYSTCHVINICRVCTTA